MQLGLIGLGKMGGNMRERLRRAGHEVIGYDINPDISDVKSLAELVKRLPAPRVVWTMVAAGEITRQTVAKLGDLLEGRPRHRRRQQSIHRRLRERKVVEGQRASAISTAVSPAASGASERLCGLMVGGTATNVRRAMPIFDALPRGPARRGFRARRESRRRALRQDGPQRHRFWPDGGVCRGYELLMKKDIVENVPGAFQGLVARHCRPVLAARSDGRCAGEESRPRGRLRLHGRLR